MQGDVWMIKLRCLQGVITPFWKPPIKLSQYKIFTSGFYNAMRLGEISTRQIEFLTENREGINAT